MPFDRERPHYSLSVRAGHREVSTADCPRNQILRRRVDTCTVRPSAASPRCERAPTPTHRFFQLKTAWRSSTSVIEIGRPPSGCRGDADILTTPRSQSRANSRGVVRAANRDGSASPSRAARHRRSSGGELCSAYFAAVPAPHRAVRGRGVGELAVGVELRCVGPHLGDSPLRRDRRYRMDAVRIRAW